MINMKNMGIVDFVKNKSQKIAQDKAKYDNAVNRSLTLGNMLKLDVKNKNIIPGRVQELKNLCPNLTSDSAEFLTNVIPIWETYLFAFIIIEKRTNDKYYMIGTDRWIWFINDYSYKIVKYSEIYLFEVIKKSLMSQVVNFNQIVFTVNDYINNVNRLVKICNDSDYRKNEINNYCKYLCGTIPIYQNLNKIMSGISIDNNKNIVLHDRKKNNIKCTYDEIEDYELMEDQTAVLKKKREDDSHAIPFAKDSCSRISIRVTFKNNTLFLMTILEPSAFSNQYSHNDTIYKENFNFAKSIIDTLERFNPNINKNP